MPRDWYFEQQKSTFKTLALVALCTFQRGSAKVQFDTKNINMNVNWTKKSGEITCMIKLYIDYYTWELARGQCMTGT